MAYDRLPQYGRHSGAPSDVWDAELSRYVTDDEERQFGREKLQELAAKRRAAEYARREQDGTVQRNGGAIRENHPLRAVLRAKADLLEDTDKTMWYMTNLWRSHAVGAAVSGGLTIAMFIHFAVHHWSQGKQAGRFPLETNFLHGVPPVNDDRDVDNVPFFWPLVFIPILCFVFHSVLLRSQSFAVYFYDNVLHHMGSAKYLAYSGAYALVAWVTLVLVGATDIFFLLTFAIAASGVYMTLHDKDWSQGREIKTYIRNLVAGEKLVIDTYMRAAGAPALAGAQDGLVMEASQTVDAVIDGAAATATGIVDATAATTSALAKFPEAMVRNSLSMVQATLNPANIVVSAYVHALALQIWLHIVILVYYIEANQNSGWDNLPWIAHFAFFMYMVPTVAQVLAFALYYFEIGEFAIFAAHEMLLVTAHTAFLCVFAGVIYFFSNQYGTLYV